MPALPRTVALYLRALACSEWKVATIERALVAICQAHKLHGFPSPRKAPEVTEVLQGIRRTIGVAPHQKDPVLVDTLRALVEPMRKDDPGDARDRALLCLGIASGCRRSELVALDVADLSFGDDGFEITIRRSKTDQRVWGARWVSLSVADPRTCPVRAMRDCPPAARVNRTSIESSNTTGLRFPQSGTGLIAQGCGMFSYCGRKGRKE
jgi:integrase